MLISFKKLLVFTKLDWTGNFKVKRTLTDWQCLEEGEQIPSCILVHPREPKLRPVPTDSWRRWRRGFKGRAQGQWNKTRGKNKSRQYFLEDYLKLVLLTFIFIRQWSKDTARTINFDCRQILKNNRPTSHFFFYSATKLLDIYFTRFSIKIRHEISNWSGSIPCMNVDKSTFPICDHPDSWPLKRNLVRF